MATSLVCTIEVTKTDGITVRVKNGTQKTQTIEIDGTTIKLTCEEGKKKSTITQQAGSVVTEVKGDKNTSKITQNDESVTIKCNSFTVDAETVTMKSKKDTTHDVKGKLTVKSQKDTTLTSSAKTTVKSTGAMSLDSSKLTATGKSGVAISGAKAELKGTSKVSISSNAAAEMKGMKVDVQATGQMNAGGAITNIGKNMTTVKGQIVKVEGALVKLG